MTTQPQPEVDLLAEVESTCVHGIDPDMEECDRCTRTTTAVFNEYVVRYPDSDEVDEFEDIGDALDWLQRHPGTLFQRSVTRTVERGEWFEVQQ